jgi:hypothetical protein
MTSSEEPDSRAPAPRPPDGVAPRAAASSNLPARRLSTAEVEAVLRRAVELQAREGEIEGSASDGMPETELIRIGNEIGLSARHIQQALAETAAEPEAEDGWFGRGFGPGTVRVSRLLRISAARARVDLDRYLADRECMVVHRRFHDRVVYTRATGFAADLQRGFAGFNEKYPRIDAPEIDVGIREADERSCYVAIGVDLRGTRTGWASGGLVTGTGTGAGLAIFLGIAVAPPAALVGVPLLLGSIWGSRAAYRRALIQKRNQLESLLDRLEHGDLLPPPKKGLLDRLGVTRLDILDR